MCLQLRWVLHCVSRGLNRLRSTLGSLGPVSTADLAGSDLRPVPSPTGRAASCSDPFPGRFHQAELAGVLPAVGGAGVGGHGPGKAWMERRGVMGRGWGQ